MTVKELVDKLQQFPQDVQVYSYGGWRYAQYPCIDTGTFHVSETAPKPVYEAMYYPRNSKGYPSGCVVMDYFLHYPELDC